MSINFTLSEIAEKIGATVLGDENHLVSSLATLASAKNHQIAFLANAKYKSQLNNTNAGAVIVSPESTDAFTGNMLVMKNPYLGFALTAQLLDNTPKSAENIHSSAVIADCVHLGENVSIGANAVIETGVVLGNNVSIGANCFIGKEAIIGENTQLWSNVSIYHRVELGRSVLVQSNTVIGSDGFGYANEKGNWLKIPQLGTVIIGDNVEIGACTTIDRGALDNTEIHDGVIIDNQVQIAHNVIVGKHSALAGGSAIAGSTTLGSYCVLGGNVGVSGHLTITDKTTITADTMVIQSIKEPGLYSSGMPAMKNRDWLKNNVRINKLEQLNKQVKVLQKQVDALNKAN